MPFAIRMTEFRNNAPVYSYWNPTDKSWHRDECTDATAYMERLDAYYDLTHYVPVWNYKGEGHERTRLELVPVTYWSPDTWKDQRPASDIPSARFWVWHKDGWVKLTVPPNECLTVSDYRTTDEGYHSESSTWRHCGDVVRWDWASSGRDCDGRHASVNEVSCPVELLKVSQGRPVPTPQWTKEYSGQRDYAAEAAGY